MLRTPAHAGARGYGKKGLDAYTLRHNDDFMMYMTTICDVISDVRLTKYLALLNVGNQYPDPDRQTVMSLLYHSCNETQLAMIEDYYFDVGEKANNGGDEETTIVYVIKKDRNFKR